MNKIDCEAEKLSSRTIGIILLPLAFALAFIGFLILPMVGLFFSIPLFIFALTFIAAPESKVCKVLLQRDN